MREEAAALLGNGCIRIYRVSYKQVSPRRNIHLKSVLAARSQSIANVFPRSRFFSRNLGTEKPFVDHQSFSACCRGAAKTPTCMDSLFSAFSLDLLRIYFYIGLCSRTKAISLREEAGMRAGNSWENEYYNNYSICAGLSACQES